MLLYSRNPDAPSLWELSRPPVKPVYKNVVEQRVDHCWPHTNITGLSGLLCLPLPQRK